MSVLLALANRRMQRQITNQAVHHTQAVELDELRRTVTAMDEVARIAVTAAVGQPGATAPQPPNGHRARRRRQDLRVINGGLPGIAAAIALLIGRARPQVALARSHGYRDGGTDRRPDTAARP